VVPCEQCRANLLHLLFLTHVLLSNLFTPRAHWQPVDVIHVCVHHLPRFCILTVSCCCCVRTKLDNTVGMQQFVQLNMGVRCVRMLQLYDTVNTHLIAQVFFVVAPVSLCSPRVRMKCKKTVCLCVPVARRSLNQVSVCVPRVHAPLTASANVRARTWPGCRFVCAQLLQHCRRVTAVAASRISPWLPASQPAATCQNQLSHVRAHTHTHRHQLPEHLADACV
jgi:hypothetical protein